MSFGLGGDGVAPVAAAARWRQNPGRRLTLT